MKAGTFEIQSYLEKLHGNIEEKDLRLNEEDAESEGGKLPTEDIVFQDDDKKAYDWLKKEFQKGKIEAKVEMSYHTFKPGYHLEDAPKSTKDFPGMYGEVKTDTMKGSEPKQASFPETKFPGMGGESNSAGETNSDLDNKTTNKDKSSEDNEDKTQNGIKVEAKEKADPKDKKVKKEGDEKEDKKKKDKKEE